MRCLTAALLACLATGASGCATLFSDSSQPIEVTSTPEGAEVLINNVPVGRTPLTTPVKRKTGHTWVTIRAEGYEPKQFRLGTTLNPVAIVNLSSIFSWSTDYTSGNLIEYTPNSFYVNLAPADGRAVSAAAKARTRALIFVLVSRHRLLGDMARQSGEDLRTLATLFAVDEADYPRFARALADHAPALAALTDRPHDLFATMVVLLRDRDLIGAPG